MNRKSLSEDTKTHLYYSYKISQISDEWMRRYLILTFFGQFHGKKNLKKIVFFFSVNFEKKTLNRKSLSEDMKTHLYYSCKIS